MNVQVNSVPIDVIAAGLIAVFLELVPPIKKHWDKLNARQKQAIMLLIVALITIASVSYDCFYLGNNCPADFWNFIVATFVTFLLNLTVNQGAYRGIKHLPASENPIGG